MEIRTQLPVRKVGAHEYPRAAKTLAASFQEDPVVSWWIPDADERGRILGPYFELALEVMYGLHDAIYTAHDLSSVAIWVPPNEWMKTSTCMGPTVILRIGPTPAVCWSVERLLDKLPPEIDAELRTQTV